MAAGPSVSVIVPVRYGGETFAACMRSLAVLAPPPLEVIVVDDGTSGDAVAQARALGAAVLTMPEPSGPAAARNRGAREARGDVLLFLDADVAAPPGIAGQVARFFAARPEVSAVMGSYDERPPDPRFLSQYKNLYQRYVHQTSREDAFTFWGACGAIRRLAFESVGGFDERYREPSVEDIELGYRLRAAGHRLALDPTLEVTHLKRWTATSLIVSDVFRRAVPWTSLILRHRRFDRDLNLTLSRRIAVGAAAVLVLALAASPVSIAARWIAAAVVLLLLVLDAPLARFFAQRKGLWFCGRAIAWQWFHYFYSGLAFAGGWLWTVAGGGRPR